VAFFFIKPGAVNDDVDALVRTRLSDRGVHVLKEGRINGKELEKVIDKHYGTLAERALHVSPADLPALSDQAEAAFADAFGLSWTDALEQGRVLNLAEAKVKAGVFPEKTSPFDIEAAWRAGKCVKLFPGTYVAAIPALNGNSDAVGQAAARQSVFVVNGFYGAMREIFVQSPVGVAWKVVAWNSSPPSSSFPSSSSLPSSSSSSTAPITASPMTLSWADFREQLVGATDPSRALPTSLRGELLKQWKSLGLAAPPAGADNGFHASASPLESLCVLQKRQDKLV
jgi:nucleoside diphosphate kinase